MGWENITSITNVNPKQFNLIWAKTPINQIRTNVGLPDWGVTTAKTAEPAACSAWLPWLQVMKELLKSNQLVVSFLGVFLALFPTPPRPQTDWLI